MIVDKLDAKTLVSYACCNECTRDAVHATASDWIVQNHGTKSAALLMAARTGRREVVIRVIRDLKLEGMWLGDAVIEATRHHHEGVVRWAVETHPNSVWMSRIEIAVAGVLGGCRYATSTMIAAMANQWNDLVSVFETVAKHDSGDMEFMLDAMMPLPDEEMIVLLGKAVDCCSPVLLALVYGRIAPHVIIGIECLVASATLNVDTSHLRYNDTVDDRLRARRVRDMCTGWEKEGRL